MDTVVGWGDLAAADKLVIFTIRMAIENEMGVKYVHVCALACIQCHVQRGERRDRIIEH